MFWVCLWNENGVSPISNFPFASAALSLKKRSPVRQYDVTGVLTSLKTAGFRPTEVWVGSVRIVLDLGDDASTPAISPAREIQDELAKHFANARF